MEAERPKLKTKTKTKERKVRVRDKIAIAKLSSKTELYKNILNWPDLYHLICKWVGV